MGPEPLCGNLLNLLSAFKDVELQPFVLHNAVVSLDVSVLLGLAGLGVQDSAPPFSRPFLQRAIDVFRTVVDADRLARSARSGSKRETPAWREARSGAA